MIAPRRTLKNPSTRIGSKNKVPSSARYRVTSARPIDGRCNVTRNAGADFYVTLAKKSDHLPVESAYVFNALAENVTCNVTSKMYVTLAQKRPEKKWSRVSS